jgi:hypothetical protein
MKNKPQVELVIEINPHLAYSPYVVGLNPDGFYQLFRDRGLSNGDINGLKLRLQPRDNSGSIRGSYELDRRELTIYTDPITKQRERLTKTARSIAEGRRVLLDPFKKTLVTKRLARYLRNSPDKDRALKFADSLLTQAVNRRANATALHEAEHVTQNEAAVYNSLRMKSLVSKAAGMGAIALSALDFDATLENPLGIVGALTSGAAAWAGTRTLYYHFSSHEMSARRFSSENVFNPKYRDLVIFGDQNADTINRVKKAGAVSNQDILRRGTYIIYRIRNPK